VTPFRRWDVDVIDWTRQTAADIWRSGNVRDVTTTGVEVSGMRRWASAFLRAYYAGQSVNAPTLTSLSKYVLEYARHSIGASLSVPIAGIVDFSATVDGRIRFDGQQYALVGLRVSHRAGRLSPFIEVSNLLNEEYHEIAGVDMPGRWLTIGVVAR
jgi:hypothetical protein